MADFFSERFGKNVWITDHARKSMIRRAVDVATLERVLREGEIKYRNDVEFWVFKHIEGRPNNLVCAAVLEKAGLIIKTVMINWELEDQP